MCEINKARMEMRAVAAKEARERELVLLDYAMKKDTAGEAEDRAKREEEKKVSRDGNHAFSFLCRRAYAARGLSCPSKAWRRGRGG